MQPPECVESRKEGWNKDASAKTSVAAHEVCGASVTGLSLLSAGYERHGTTLGVGSAKADGR
jgi:hypothetical protein